MQINKANKQRRRILRRLWENERRNKIMEKLHKLSETISPGQTTC